MPVGSPIDMDDDRRAIGTFRSWNRRRRRLGLSGFVGSPVELWSSKALLLLLYSSDSSPAREEREARRLPGLLLRSRLDSRRCTALLGLFSRYEAFVDDDSL